MRASHLHTANAPPGDSWADYLRYHLDRRGWNNTDLAERAGFDRSLVSRWMEGKLATPDTVRKVCRAFGRDIREGLIAAGMFTAAELRATPSEAPDPSLLSDEELLKEVAVRMTRGTDHEEPLRMFAEVLGRTSAHDGSTDHVARTVEAEDEDDDEEVRGLTASDR